MSETLIPAESPDELLAIDLAGTPANDVGEWLSTMVLIREFEESLEDLTSSGKIPGGVHLAVGQEAVAVGAIRALETGDIVSSGHRGHHHALAIGIPPRSIMAELFGRATGCAGGRGGTMHLADFSLGYYGGNGIVGAGLGLAMGAALAAQLRGSSQVAMGFFGDGGTNTGRTWEAVNMAALWKLPLIAFCENNLYAVETFIGRSAAGTSITDRASGFGLPAVQVDGQDVGAVYRAVREARDRAAQGGGPTFIEAQTYRYYGHNTGEVVTYRTAEEVETWKRQKDPIQRLWYRLAATTSSRSALEARERGSGHGEGRDRVRRFVSMAGCVHRRRRRPRAAVRSTRPTMSAAPAVTVGKAFQLGMHEEMERDERIFVLGTDLFIRGGHFAQVKGLGQEFGRERVRDAPISEAAMIAAGVGAALNGMRPVVDLNFVDFALGAMDEIVNQAAKIRYMWGRSVPLVVRASAGVALYAAQHNNSLESLFAHTPGLAVVMPSTPADTKAMIKTALRTDDPVMFLMHKRLTGLRGDVGGADDLVPLGVGVIRRAGNDVTLVSYGGMMDRTLTASEGLVERGIEAEVIDLRTLFPLDLDLLVESVRRTGRLAVVTEEPHYAGLGSEIAASIQEAAFDYLDAPVLRINATHSPIPHSPPLIEALTPQVPDIVSMVASSFERWPSSGG